MHVHAEARSRGGAIARDTVAFSHMYGFVTTSKRAGNGMSLSTRRAPAEPSVTDRAADALAPGDHV